MTLFAALNRLSYVTFFGLHISLMLSFSKVTCSLNRVVPCTGGLPLLQELMALYLLLVPYIQGVSLQYPSLTL